MLQGVGIDIVKIEKFKCAVERWGDAFIERIFNPEEVVHINPGKMYYQRLAARFAAKEAVIKSIPDERSYALRDILIFNHSNGAPYCTLKKNSGLEVLISISHIEDYAVACAVAQQKS